MYYIALESDCFKASACAGAASFSLLELELEPERHPYVEISEFRTPAPADTVLPVASPAPNTALSTQSEIFKGTVSGNLHIWFLVLIDRSTVMLLHLTECVP
jgi:hypothetical protein